MRGGKLGSGGREVGAKGRKLGVWEREVEIGYPLSNPLPMIWY